MALAYGAVGAIIGAVAGPYVFSILLDWVLTVLHADQGWSAAISGVPGAVLALALTIFATAFGCVTGCMLVHTWSAYRLSAALGLIIFGVLAALLSAYFGLSFATGYGRRAALAIFGLYFAWSALLILWGSVLLVKSIRAESD